MFSVTDPSLSFGEQLDSLQRAYDAVTKKEAGNAVAVFHRYFLSDAANQADILMERECENPFCALSIVQQAPLNGTKIALWTWLQTGMATETCNSGMFEASQRVSPPMERRCTQQGSDFRIPDPVAAQRLCDATDRTTLYPGC